MSDIKTLRYKPTFLFVSVLFYEQMRLAFSSYDELRCLHLTICEAKFHSDPDRKDVQGSPFVAETAHKVFDLLIEFARSEKEAEDLKVHRVLRDDSIIYPVIQQRCKEVFSRERWTAAEKQEFLDDMAAPYIVSESMRNQLLDQ